MSKETEASTLTETQLEIMHILWEHPDSTLGDIWSLMNAQRPLAKNTVQTLLTRLVERGWVATRSEGKVFLYRSARERQTACRQIVSRVLDAAFLGSTEGLVMALLSERKITPAEAERLRKLIDAAERNDS